MQQRLGSTTQRSGRGFSMVEVAISALVLGLMLTGAMRATGMSAQIRSDQSLRNRATLIASDVMSEVRAAPFPGELVALGGSKEGTSRTAFDDKLDFMGYWSEPARWADGGEITGLPSTRLSIEGAWVEDQGGSLREVTEPTGLLAVRVRIARGFETIARTDALMSVHGASAP